MHVFYHLRLIGTIKSVMSHLQQVQKQIYRESIFALPFGSLDFTIVILQMI